MERKKNEEIKGLISKMWLFFVTQYNSSLPSFVPNFRARSQVVAEKSLTEKNNKFSMERKKKEEIKGLICKMWLFFVTQYTSSLPSFVPNSRALSQVVAEKSLTEKTRNVSMGHGCPRYCQIRFNRALSLTKGHNSNNNWWILSIIERDLYCMITYLCIKYESNTPTYSKDIARKPFFIRRSRAITLIITG